METIGYIAIIFFGMVGFTITAIAIAEYIAVLFNVFTTKVGKEVEVRKEHINAVGESKKLRLAKKREVRDAIAEKKLENKLDKVKIQANEQFGERVFDIDSKKTVFEKSVSKIIGKKSEEYAESENEDEETISLKDNTGAEQVNEKNFTEEENTEQN